MMDNGGGKISNGHGSFAGFLDVLPRKMSQYIIRSKLNRPGRSKLLLWSDLAGFLNGLADIDIEGNPVDTRRHCELH